jgi:hypothetical protein
MQLFAQNRTVLRALSTISVTASGRNQPSFTFRSLEIRNASM